MNHSRMLSAARAAVVFFTFGTLPISAHSTLIITEFLADPPPGLIGDANGDAVRSSYDDEFIELVNSSPFELDISDWTLSDSITVRHVFPSATLVPSGGAVVVFGGGTPTGIPGLVFTASTGTLGLNNSGDTITLSDGSTTIASVIYGTEAGNDQSLSRIALDASEFVGHSDIPGAFGALFSPGTSSTETPYTLTVQTDDSIAVSVPEPNTLGLLAAGLIGVTVCGKSKLKSTG